LPPNTPMIVNTPTTKPNSSASAAERRIATASQGPSGLCENVHVLTECGILPKAEIPSNEAAMSIRESCIRRAAYLGLQCHRPLGRSYIEPLSNDSKTKPKANNSRNTDRTSGYHGNTARPRNVAVLDYQLTKHLLDDISRL
jgi:hypothetical protein